jgi:hypothetical protein
MRNILIRKLKICEDVSSLTVKILFNISPKSIEADSGGRSHDWVTGLNPAGSMNFSSL